MRDSTASYAVRARAKARTRVCARLLLRAAVGLTVSLVLACREEPSPSRSLPELPVEPEQATRVVWRQECAQCHGETGRGDGPQTIELWTQPPNFHDPEWQASVSDARIEDAIVQGGTAVGLSRWMPAYPELAERPEVVARLRETIRAWGD